MEDKKYKWSEKRIFKHFYYNQLRRLEEVMLTHTYIDFLNEESSIEEIYERFDAAIERIKWSKQTVTKVDEKLNEPILCLFLDIEEKVKEFKYFNSKREASHYANMKYYGSYLIAQK